MVVEKWSRPGGVVHRTTIRDVAAKADVSVTTASRALNGTGRMSEETRSRVERVARELDYRPNYMARGLVQQRSFTLGLLTDDTYGRFTLPVAAGLSSAMTDKGVSVFLSAGEHEAHRLELNLRAMEEKRIDGLVISGKRIDRGLPIDVSSLGMPVVYVYSLCPEDAVGFVPDDINAARTAVQHLIGLGRRKIAHIAGRPSFEASHLRETGWRMALEENGLTPCGEALYSNWTEAHGYEAAFHLIATAGERPDAIFCSNDQIARGVIDAFVQMGIKVPDDIAIVGFDNWEVFAKATRPPLTTMDMELTGLGKSAGLALLDMIEGKPIEVGVRKTPCHLVVRESCGAGKPE
ncbi:transcriptional regulator, LacI family [Cohaesibacter sp. ES.047]|uniref:LacI family DNA-binding transcriptional regulator n=1 Tax=Cohaesibacter sp. ES.047 TaxID=1798205 RepID=UPI000BC0D1E7|nr:LacI family DNA-binding transcriptional regulator [Cohaesibacter sp. ES.047]SNY90699.1 transcriptional regulator, LacI family [Cohaesibacter sp. ES.047]